jgi:dihydroorotate dehydrogenase
MTPALASLATPLLRRLDPERSHRLAIMALRLGLAGSARADDPRLAINAMGLSLPNPIGLAAGFDKGATAIRGLRRLGFGAIETGTATLRPQPGNPCPRVFRLEPDRAIINRYGLNSDGIERYVAHLASSPRGRIPIGANVGINKEGADPERDYPRLVAAVAPHCDYVVINVSSPNTPGLRDLQGEARLRGILAAVAAAVPSGPPIVLKLAPDLDETGLEAALETAMAHGVRGVILGNTTIDRPETLRSHWRGETGGLSGPPLMARSTKLLAHAHRVAGGKLVLIGCGGVASGRDVLRKLRAGASFVQLYTAFAYDGPALLTRIKRELLAALDAEGFKSAAEAVGSAR